MLDPSAVSSLRSFFTDLLGRPIHDHECIEDTVIEARDKLIDMGITL